MGKYDDRVITAAEFNRGGPDPNLRRGPMNAKDAKAMDELMKVLFIGEKGAARSEGQRMDNETYLFGRKIDSKAMPKLATAKQMLESGADPRQVWQQTGWFKAPWDGKWRYEVFGQGVENSNLRWDNNKIPDKDAPIETTGMYNNGRKASGDPRQGVEWPAYIDHVQINAAYPDMDSKMKFDDSDITKFVGTHYNPVTDTININPNESKDQKAHREAALKGLQARIQHLEGFSSFGEMAEKERDLAAMREGVDMRNGAMFQQFPLEQINNKLPPFPASNPDSDKWDDAITREYNARHPLSILEMLLRGKR